ncbi:MAG TPA: MXAN_5187 C-terminal domain-containing protein, partial [Polyangiales bacterium]|nr:MXAN_5187 C-terminal domain-containing protein [Polyangiales bacterium]
PAGAKPIAAAAPRAPAPPPSAANNAALSNDDVQRIFTNYVAARKQNSERVDNVKLDSIEKTLRGMLPGLEKKHAGKKIDFEVVVKDGKVALKPVAK